MHVLWIITIQILMVIQGDRLLQEYVNFTINIWYQQEQKVKVYL